MAINNRKNDGLGFGGGLDQFERRLAFRAVKEAFQAPTKADIDAQDKALTDQFNKIFGANIDYGTDGYDAMQNASPTPYTKPTTQDKELTKILNNEFGGHVSFATDKHNNRKTDHKLTDALNSMSGGNLGYAVTDPAEQPSGADQDKALTDAMNGMFGTQLGYTSGDVSSLSDADFKAQDESLDETIKRLLGTDLK